MRSVNVWQSTACGWFGIDRVHQPVGCPRQTQRIGREGCTGSFEKPVLDMAVKRRLKMTFSLRLVAGGREKDWIGALHRFGMPHAARQRENKQSKQTTRVGKSLLWVFAVLITAK